MKIEVNTQQYLNLTAPAKNIADNLDIEVSSHAYLPRIDDLSSDWVSYIAAPAFKLARKLNGGPLASFCSIGTGSGLDVLTAIELLDASQVAFTDLQAEVVDTAAENVRKNIARGKTVTMTYGAGDLLSPLADKAPKFDVIYENLPNVPLDANDTIVDKRNSGHFLEKRKEAIPELVHTKMLDLHYLAFVQARDYLNPKGAIYSTLGARIDLASFYKLGELAGYRSEIFTYSWKVQAEVEDNLKGYAKQEAEGLGPFNFYHTADLKAVFDGLTVEESGRRADEIEKTLSAKKLTATEALAAWQKGAEIGHTVIVLKSTPR